MGQDTKIIYVELTGLPPMANGQHGHWKKSWAIKKVWKQRMGYALMNQLPNLPYQKVKVVFTRFSSSEPDYDGLVHGFKPIRDALVIHGIVIDDKSSCMEAEYRWLKAAKKSGKITIEITPLVP